MARRPGTDLGRGDVDFYSIVINEKKDGTLHIRPDWKVGRSKDLMTRGGSFYAVWDEAKGLWSTDIYDVQRLVDADLQQKAKELEDKTGHIYHVSSLESNGTKLWDEFQRFIRNSGNNSHNLDEKLIFANTDVKKDDYASKRLPYALAEGAHPSWDAVVGTLYSEAERAKIEWAIGAVVSGDSKSIQKFLVFYGPPGSGKSTILNIIQKLFSGYTAVFDARELAGNNNAFATSAFKTNPLVAIQHDGDLSRIYDNTKLNSIVAHEVLPMNEKYKAVVEMRANAFLFMGTNVPVKITDSKSGIIRRLIDVVPTGKTIEHDTYHILMEKVNFELGAIAHHCLQRYKSMGKNYYSSYRPTDMMLQTDVFYNFVEAHFDIFKHEDGITLKKAWDLYKEYCASTGIDRMLPQYKFREELKNYFEEFEERARVEGVNLRSYYSGFKSLNLEKHGPTPEMPIRIDGVYEIQLVEQPSIFDDMYAGAPAQYAKEDGTPTTYWSEVTTTLADLDTSQLHYVKLPQNHIVIDFDLVNEDGDKDMAFNLREANKWPATYTEVSKSGEGIHLHYIYTGDVTELASVYDVGVEVKVFPGDASCRRRLTKCNDMNVMYISDGLPTKEKKVLSTKTIQTEKGLRDLVARNLRKEIHAGTKPSVDFIKHILDEAYDAGVAYNLEDMRGDILTFALRSSNQSETCVKTVQQMKFVGKEVMPEVQADEAPLAFYDVEVYPNLFVVCWKYEGSDQVVRMVNPEPKEIEALFSMRLVGFNNRRYDNHILYARYLGYSLEAIFDLSQKIVVGNDRNVFFGEAYNLSYADIYDFSSKKQGLKKFQIELGIHHLELDIPWDEPVPEDMWDKVVEYCVNDVISTEKVFESRKQDFVARQILGELSGLSVNHTTQNHTAKIIFGDDKEPQRSFIYTDLSGEFPGYHFDGKESTYRGEVTGEGGYVYAEPGIYTEVALLDVASMHPTSIEILDLFGPYTKRFSDLKTARMAIKRKDYETAAVLLDGKLAPFLGSSQDDESSAEALSYALKIVINIVYGLTSARFPNPFKDNRNKDNIVAKRGALFMIDLKHEVQQRGFTVAHIKTDSIKIPNATPEIINFVMNFGLSYGYDFEHETTYDKFCLVNDAVYIAEHDGHWTAVGAQFQHPYVFKSLFSKEEIVFDDYCETKNVKEGRMYLDFSGTGDIHQMVHVGRTGSFVPVLDGGKLWRIKDDKLYAVTGTKDHLWVDRDVAIDRQKTDGLNLDMSYFDDLKQKAITAIMKFCMDDDLCVFQFLEDEY
jgi:energy-coupling factor transporter ATP-binding protein EcfA2